MDSHSVLSSQDKKDLDKFIKFFALKTVQVIVQARLGETVSTCSSSSPTGSDWFSLAIKDIPEVTHEAKKVLAGQLPTIGKSMCVEISLKTSEGDSMELETWCLEVNEKCDRDIKVSYTVYNRLSLLLKSLLSITRVTPAYKLSRKQGHDYVILYRIYFGDVQMAHLGEGFRTVCVGVVGTPIGTVTLSCAYRTNLALMSTRGFGRTVPVMGVIIDHFVDHPFGNMGHVNMCNYRTACEEERAVYPEMDDSEEACAVSFSTSPPSQLHSSHFSCQPPAVRMADPCYLTACTAAHPHQPCRGVQAEHQRVVVCSHADTSHHVPAPPSSRYATLLYFYLSFQFQGLLMLSLAFLQDALLQKRVWLLNRKCIFVIFVTTGNGRDTEALTRSGGTSGSSPSDIQKTTFWRKVGAFVNKPHSQVTTTGVELPFAAFVSKTLDLEENDPMVRPPESPSTASPSPGSLHSVSSSQSGGPTQDDYILVDFKPAFSKDGLLPMDLGTFYREFQNPPQLSVVSADDSAQSMAEDLDSLPEKLASYEKNMEEFDAFVETLQ
ncbi:autophagy-related protein 13-like [Scleropages formosus]|uniref:autophagy-related protein 13-like n=1 Tax=Scleropages formosus TaxID=113540 RepID=UPI00087913F8|nr:autophagy-related protein 13-like [Scleropages formosus]